MLRGRVASIIAWQLGGVLGPGGSGALLRATPDGDRLDEPLHLHAFGLLLAPPVGALVGFIAAVAAVGERDPRVEWDEAPATREKRPGA
jgi:hypothetical protein